MRHPRADAFLGTLQGMAIGDALGLPYENLSPRRAQRCLGPADRYRFLGHWGMISDDTEHACMTAQALCASGGEPEAFLRSLGWRLRWWFATLPAGVGLATAKACVRLWLGFSPRCSGVFSAGNGPAMRAPILGVACDSLADLRALVTLATHVTHTDPLAEQGAWAIALAAHQACRAETLAPQAFLTQFQQERPDAEPWWPLLRQAVASAERGETTAEFAQAQGWTRGVSGFILHTVPVVLHAWFRHSNDLLAAVQAVIACGGDTDTTAAIVGGIVGARLGGNAIPAGWTNSRLDWPRTAAWMRCLAERTAVAMEQRRPMPPPRLWVPLLWPRNLLFLAGVLTHALRRLLPPY